MEEMDECQYHGTQRVCFEYRQLDHELLQMLPAIRPFEFMIHQFELMDQFLPPYVFLMNQILQHQGVESYENNAVAESSR